MPAGVAAAGAIVRVVALDAAELRLDIANDIAAIAAALDPLQRFGALAGLGPRLQNRLEVVFEELVSNVIRHGFTPGSGQRLRVHIAAGDEGVTLAIADDGRPFDPLAHAAPAPLSDLATAPAGGLGIALVGKLASRFDYRAGGNEDGFNYVNRVTVTLARP